MKRKWKVSLTVPQTNADLRGMQKSRNKRVKRTRCDTKLKQRIVGHFTEQGLNHVRIWKHDEVMQWPRWQMTCHCINKMNQRIKCVRTSAELSYPWRKAGPGASMSHLGGAPGESEWSFSPAGASGIPWLVETGRGRGGGGRTRRTEGTEGAGRRKSLEEVGDLEDGRRERRGEKEGGGGR